MENYTIGLKLHTPYLEKPISENREDAKKSLLEKNKNSDSKLICVDGTNFSDEVKIANNEIIRKIDSVLLLPAGIDGIIAKTSEKVELALPVGDCGLLVAYHKDLTNFEKIIGNAHLGYKGIISNGDLKKNGIIENFLNSLKYAANTEKLNEFRFFLAPLAGQNFELPKTYFYAKIAPFIKKENNFIKPHLRLLPESFIKKSLNTYQDIEGERVYFDLKGLILYILRNRYLIDIPDKNIDKRSTTNPKNKLSSFRTHTIANNIPKEILETGINDENFFNMPITREQLEVYYSGNLQHYLDTNSRLSLNIFTK